MKKTNVVTVGVWYAAALVRMLFQTLTIGDIPC
jgi:hypothetical protein